MTETVTAREQFPNLAALLVNGKAPQRILDELVQALDLIDRLTAERLDAEADFLALLQKATS